MTGTCRKKRSWDGHLVLTWLQWWQPRMIRPCTHTWEARMLSLCCHPLYNREEVWWLMTRWWMLVVTADFLLICSESHTQWSKLLAEGAMWKWDIPNQIASMRATMLIMLMPAVPHPSLRIYNNSPLVPATCLCCSSHLRLVGYPEVWRSKIED